MRENLIANVYGIIEEKRGRNGFELANAIGKQIRETLPSLGNIEKTDVIKLISFVEREREIEITYLFTAEHL